MLDDYEISKRFGYKNTSNLVIQTNQRNRENVPNGEAESLAGRIKYKMGDLANRKTKPKKEKKQIKKKKSKSIVNENDISNILELDIHKDTNIYIPKTIETRVAYDELLGILTDILGSQPSNILDDIAFELLVILKNDEISDEEKRKQFKEIAIDISNEEYGKILDKSRILTDFNSNINEEFTKETDDTSEVAVIFDESESNDEDEYGCELDDEADTENEAEEYLDEISEADDDINEDRKSNEYIHISSDLKEEANHSNDPDIIDINKMDAYWLQRELYSLLNDAEKSLKLEREIIPILFLEDDQECENSLVILFNYEHFTWIKKLLKNRWSIYYCTILGQASSDLEREKIINDMKNHPQGSVVLDLMSKPLMSKNHNSSFLKSVGKYIESNVIDTEDKSNLNKQLFSKKSRKILDLEQIYLEQSMNLNLSTKVVLPEGSERIEKVDYDSISIPPVIKSHKEKVRLISIDELPDWCKECFSCVSIRTLNEIQSKVFETAFKEFEENLLVCAPTGSGKTNIAMLCILNILSQYITNLDDGGFGLDVSKFKIVYVSPTKALVAEQVESLRIRLRPLGIKVNEMTGDTRISRSLMELTQVFITTPEKFDVVTRKSTDGLSDKLKLIIFDEVHMLHDSRGAIIEGLIARFKNSYVRLVGLSATLPNYLDIAEFLNVDPKKGMYHFGPEYRPVPLLQTFIGIKTKKGYRKLQLMNDIVYEKIIEDISQHQVLVFVHSRKDTLQTAKYIRDQATEKGKLNNFFSGNRIISREILLNELNEIKSNNLKEILPSGIGIHHSGLVRSDRKIVEDLFADGHIRVLISTATLAWGVNLPAHTVIIKGTQIYQPEKGEWTELSPLDMLQMIGRGGRPQYDNNGHGIVITDFDHLTYYLSLLNQQLNIESQLIPKLPDLINAEISLGNITSKSDVMNWITKTFLYIRMKKNPKLYGLNLDHIIDDNSNAMKDGDTVKDNDTLDRSTHRDNKQLFIQELDTYLLKLIDSALDRLEKCSLIQHEHRSGQIDSLLLGKISSHFYLSPETIQDINKQLLPNLSEIQLFRLFSTCKEFKFLLVRNEEKIELEKLVDKVPIPIQGVGSTGVGTGENIGLMIDLDTCTKVNVLLQLYLTGSRWINAKLTLLSDLHYIVQSAPRIFRAIFHLSINRRWSNLAKRALKIATVSLKNKYVFESI